MLIIQKSNIHGIGLFTTEPIKKNTRLYGYEGIEMSLKDFKLKYGDYKNNSLHTYLMRRINRIIVAKEEPFKTKNIVNFMNESIEPNCILTKRALYSLRDIEPNEELTIKYPRDYNRANYK